MITAGVTFTAANGPEVFPYVLEAIEVVAATIGRNLADDNVGSPCKPTMVSVASATRLGSE
jgi:hypothetical protein